jgi:hypothetical protein
MVWHGQTAVHNAIDRGAILGPRLRISGNAVDILGGHEDAIAYNPEQHIFSNATYGNVHVFREDSIEDHVRCVGNNQTVESSLVDLRSHIGEFTQQQDSFLDAGDSPLRRLRTQVGQVLCDPVKVVVGFLPPGDSHLDEGALRLGRKESSLVKASSFE